MPKLANAENQRYQTIPRFGKNPVTVSIGGYDALASFLPKCGGMTELPYLLKGRDGACGGTSRAFTNQ
jgi:hypothetical protein